MRVSEAKRILKTRMQLGCGTAVVAMRAVAPEAEAAAPLRKALDSLKHLQHILPALSLLAALRSRSETAPRLAAPPAARCPTPGLG